MASGDPTPLPKPLGLLAELTHRCPLRCPYCSNPPVEGQRREQNGRHLGQFRRLDAESAEPEPAARAVDRPGEQHRDEHEGHDPGQRPDELLVAVGAVVDAHHDRQHRDAGQGIEDLPGDEVIGLARLPPRFRTRP